MDELQNLQVKVTQSCPTLCNPMDCPWNSPGQNTGVGTLSLFQRIFPTQRLNPGLPHFRQILYQLSHKGNPRILPSRSSQPRNWTRVSCIAGRFFTNWAIREAPDLKNFKISLIFPICIPLLFYSNSTTPLKGLCYHPHLTYKETEAQRA